MTDPQPGGGPFIDLHTHSNLSDGELEPSQLVERAAAAGLAALALWIAAVVGVHVGLRTHSLILASGV
ncbi:MAG: hypothetical protein ACE5IL_09960, partial [Myxococcota bacterium]